MWLRHAYGPRNVYRWTALYLSAFWLLAAWAAAADTPKSLTIVGARIESSEDAPAVSSAYEFLPGDFLYFQFEVAGFKISGNEYSGPRTISLAYDIEVRDSGGTLLAPTEKAAIKEEVAPQDKDWLPKRRASFLLPSYASYQHCQVILTVNDLLDKTTAHHEFPFILAGTKIDAVPSLAIQNVRFLRSSEDGPGIQVVAYRPGDTIWARFDMTGFQLGPHNLAQLSYDVTVRRPDGRVIFHRENAARQKLQGLFYPPQVVPGVLSVTTTPDLRHGEYKVIISLKDEIGQKTVEVQREVDLE
ncbi:MAG TPA: hypothetical protein VN633_14590 [Bryobacteraceae bacterium]|nr:hypothetical protein [Bryobacteraceae bacterium]